MGIIAWTVNSQGSNMYKFIASVSGGLFFAIACFLPFGLLMFGFISDIVNQEFRNSYISLVTFATLIASGAAGRAFASARGIDLSTATTSFTEQGWCSLPGLEAIESPYIPMVFLSTSLILTFYTYFAVHTNQHNYIYIAFVGILCIQVLSFTISGCSKSYVTIFSDYGIGLNMLASIILGVSVGVLVSAMFTPDAFQPFGSDNGKKWASVENFSLLGPHRQPTLAGKNGPDDAPTCSPPQGGDENTFVAELYKNGQLITEKIA
jgi:hypothetical protein